MISYQGFIRLLAKSTKYDCMDAFIAFCDESVSVNKWKIPLIFRKPSGAWPQWLEHRWHPSDQQKTTMDFLTHLSEQQMSKAIKDVENMFSKK